MVVTDSFADPKVQRILDKVSNKSIEDHYNPYTLFEWPETLPEDRLWMPLELMTIHHMPAEKTLTEAELIALSKWESINFYSLNIHGIRELLVEVCRRIHTNAFAMPSEFFHHFIEEENSHLWIFAQFCLRYGGKIYPERRMPATAREPAVEQFMIFAKILIFEEIVDYYNVRIAQDESLHPFVREINRLHHHDESRHIACSRELVEALFGHVRQSVDASELPSIEEYLRQYIVACVESLYNPSAYLDAKLPVNAYQLRREALRDENRKRADQAMLKRTMGFFHSRGIFSSEVAAI